MYFKGSASRALEHSGDLLADVQRMTARAAEHAQIRAQHEALHQQEIARQIANSNRILEGTGAAAAAAVSNSNTANAFARQATTPPASAAAAAATPAAKQPAPTASSNSK